MIITSRGVSFMVFPTSNHALLRKISLWLFLLVATGCNTGMNQNNLEPIDYSGPYEKIPGIPLVTSRENLLSDKVVYVFSECGTSEADPQVLKFPNSVNMRAWQKWEDGGDDPNELKIDYIKDCHDKGILFIGGGTCSILFRTECENQEEFEDMATRDATGELVEHDYIVPGAHRGSLANPAYRKHIVEYCKVHIDSGMDGLSLDEGIPSYMGGKKWGRNGNEAFDDYFIKDFNEYLLNKFPGYSKQEWITQFKMSENNCLDPDLPADDIENNFNYREHLKENGWDSDPLTDDNPLSKLWGCPGGNRYDPNDPSFTNKYIAKYWLEIVKEIRSYAKEKYNKEVIITANGYVPDTEFHTFGLYEGNYDYLGRPVNYVPTTRSGDLDAGVSMKDIYLELLRKGNLASPGAPMILFLDWPTDMMDTYYELPLSQKKDFWKIYASEAYACGLRYAFHLKTSMPDEPSAQEQGVLEFLSDFSAFFECNKAVYLGVENTNTAVELSKPNITYNVTKKDEFLFLHLINHNYKKSIKPQENLKVSLPVGFQPKELRMISPDFSEVKNIEFATTGNTLNFTVDRIDSYNVIAIN